MMEEAMHVHHHSSSCTCSLMPPVINVGDPLAATSLLEALSKWGWAPLVDDDAKSKLVNVKATVTQLLATSSLLSSSSSETSSSNSGIGIGSTGSCNNITYRGRMSESGGGLHQTEPKQSLEMTRCRGSHHHHNDSTATATSILHEWCDTLHSVAQKVHTLLKLPETIMVQDECHCGSYSSSTTATTTTTTKKRCNVDLLRVFQYDAILPSKNDKHTSLGSSPHTDWGSWTVVWQDSPDACLQTYCRACQTYIHVTPSLPLSSQSSFDFIIHVGDVLSLAMNHASITTTTTTNNNNKNNMTTIFPSPQHRVLSPKYEPRVSLVYFCYPPPGITLATIETSLQDGHCSAILPANGRCAMINYSDYYILKNQTNMIDEDNNNDYTINYEQAIYQSIRSIPLDQVIAAKWNQVQRTIS